MGFVDIQPGKTQRRGLAQFGGGKMALGVPTRGVRGQALSGEGAGGRLEGALVFGQVEIHSAPRFVLPSVCGNAVALSFTTRVGGKSVTSIFIIGCAGAG